MRTQIAPEAERLVSESGGGIELPSLCEAILISTRDNGGISLDEAIAISQRTHNYKTRRIQTLYGGTPEESRRRFVLAVLAQLTLRRFLTSDAPDRWSIGPDFVSDTMLDVIPSSNGKWTQTIARIKPLEASEHEKEDERLRVASREDLAKLAQKLEPYGKGLRPRDDELVEKLKASILRYGILPQFPMIRDNYGHLLAGWHRRWALEDLKKQGAVPQDTEWPVETVTVRSVAHALGIAWASNCGKSFTKTQIRDLEEMGYKWLTTESKTKRVEACLRADPSRGPADIAREVDCDEALVVRTRDRLVSNGDISPIESKPGPKVDEAQRARIEAAWRARPDASNREIGDEVDCSQAHAGNVRHEMVARGDLEPKQRGRRASKETTAPGRKKIAAREQKRYGCMYEDELKAKIADMRFKQGLERRQVCQVFGDDRDHLSLVLRLWNDLTHESKPTEPQGDLDQEQQAAQRETQARTPQGEFPYYTVSSDPDGSVAAPSPEKTNGRRWTQQEHSGEDVKPQHCPDRAVVLSQAQQLSADDQLWLRVQLGCHCAAV